jgi:ketosteroid isomerase-like protein
MPKVNSPVGWKPFLAIGFALLFMIPAASALKGFPPGERQMPRNVRHETKHEIDHLEDVWRDAVLSGNISAMDQLLADDYMAITPTGTLQSKDQALANLRGGKVHFTSIDLSDRKVRFYGTTALVTSRAEVNATGPAGDITGSYRYTRVYVRDAKGVWRIVSFEASRIREPDDHK